MKGLLLAAAMGAILLSGCTGKTAVPETAVLENIATRTSIRAYDGREVDNATIEKVLKAGMAAPSARNMQPWVFYVIRDRETLEALGETLPYAKMTASAAFAIIPCGNSDKFAEGEGREYWVQDLSAATENMLLAAHALGLGAVWTGVYPISGRMEEVWETAGIDRRHIPLCVIPMGYPAENPSPKDKWNPESVIWK
ncbi:MAG TPA: nitroreductase family protein [Candidatus Coprenecus stercoripullorum]|nr:nitroreductase family protein [Candidatus Coprenecus stercoripullorum]